LEHVKKVDRDKEVPYNARILKQQEHKMEYLTELMIGIAIAAYCAVFVFGHKD